MQLCAIHEVLQIVSIRVTSTFFAETIAARYSAVVLIFLQELRV